MRTHAVLALLLVCAAATAGAQPLFHAVSDPVQPNPAIAAFGAGGPETRARQVTFDAAYFLQQVSAPSSADPQLTLNLFPDAQLVSKRLKVRQDGPAWEWTGTVEGAQIYGRAIFSVVGDKIAGFIQKDDQVYFVRPITASTMSLAQLAQRFFPPEQPPFINFEFDAIPIIARDGNYTLRVMPVMDQSFSAICLLPGLQTLYEVLYEALLNCVWDSFTTDTITADVTIYCSSRSATGGDMTADLTWVATDATVAAERDAREADLVSFVIPSGTPCGRGYYNPPPVTVTDESRAFSVVRDDCAVSNYSLPHELGHNLGMQHDRDQFAGGGDPAMCNYGYHITIGGTPVQRTVMAYDCAGGGCTRIGTHSYPFSFWLPLLGDVVYGEDCSFATSANNVDQLQDAAPFAERWR